MRIMHLFLFVLIFNSLCGQDLESRKDFFVNIILDGDDEEFILSTDGSSDRYMMFLDNERGFNINKCFFEDTKYYSDSIWAEIITKSDIEYFIEQIDKYKNFKWSLVELPENVVLYSKKQGKRYSRKVMRFHRGIRIGFDIKTINHFSLPIYNLNNDFALLYRASYSGPGSASTSAQVYLKIDGEWRCVGILLHSIS